MIAVFIALAIVGKMIDRFIPHIHPFQMLFLLVGIAFLGIIRGLILINLTIIVGYLLFGTTEITAFMISMHIIGQELLVIVGIIKYWNIKNKTMYLISATSLIMGVMTIYLFFVILGDSDYSPKSISILKRMYLALIFPGDGLNVLITTMILMMVLPVTINVLKKTYTPNQYRWYDNA